MACRQDAERRAADVSSHFAAADAVRTAAETRASDLTTALADEQGKAAALRQAVHSLKVVRAGERQAAQKR